MTAENPLGEILELVPKEASGRDGRASRGATWAKVPVASAAGALDTKRPTAADPEAAPKVVARRASPACVASWRASSYDLLTGLSVCDLSGKMPTRIFNALFSDDGTTRGVAGRKQR